MKVLGVRHFGIPAQDLENSVEFYRGLGFEVKTSGADIINGQSIDWIKMENKDGDCIELLKGGFAGPHLAVEVEAVDRGAYYFMTPSGHKVQFGFDPAGFLVEYVETP